MLQNAEYAYFISLKDFKTQRTKVVPRAAVAYGRQLKIGGIISSDAMYLAQMQIR